MPLQRVRPGQGLRPSASTWNAHTKAAEIVLGKRLTQDGDISQFSPPGYLRMRNNSGARLDRFSVVGLSGSLVGTPSDDYDTWKNEFVINTNNYQSDIYSIGITQTSMEPGEVADVLVSGITVARVNISSEQHPFASATATTLFSDFWGGAKILRQESSGTGEKWCVVQLGHGLCPTYLSTYYNGHYYIYTTASPPDTAQLDVTMSVENVGNVRNNGDVFLLSYWQPVRGVVGATGRLIATKHV